MSMIRVPKLYVVASKIAKAVKEEGASLKELVYSHKYRHFSRSSMTRKRRRITLTETIFTDQDFYNNMQTESDPYTHQFRALHLRDNTLLETQNIKALYALVIETLSRESVLGELLERTRILENEQHLLWDPWLVRILVTELLWRKQRLPPGGKRIQTILHYEPGLREELASLEAAGVPVEKSAEVNKPRYARVNTLVATFEEVVGDLQDQGWKHRRVFGLSYPDFLDAVVGLREGSFLRDTHLPELLVFPKGTEFFTNPLYCSGAIVLQDKASLLPVHLLNPPPGSVVLDLCAAPGMKTSHIAAVMNNQGTVYAVERNAKRYRTLCEKVKQYGATCVKTLLADALTVDSEQCPGVEYILVDPSCSGSGIVDRVSSVTEKVDPERLQRLATVQALLLKHALTSFSAAKRVVYSTCSLDAEENEQVVEEALSYVRSARSPHRFELSTPFGGEDRWISRGSDQYKHGPRCLYARPHVDLTNGFFVAVFERLPDVVSDVAGESESKKRKLSRKKKKLKQY